MLRVDYARWGQTPEDLRHLALSAPHARTRDRALALFDITRHSCATQVAVRTGRRAHTVLGWVHAYNDTAGEFAEPDWMGRERWHCQYGRSGIRASNKGHSCLYVLTGAPPPDPAEFA